MKFQGAAKRLDDIDLPRVGALIGVGEDEIHAILDVEARGSGFDPQGRPKILFEPHVFYRNLSGAKRTAAVKAGLAYARWRPGAYGPESAQYPKLARAMAIDETAALKACSWGLGQILGENHKMIGYATVQAMVAAFVESEAAHLEGVIRFIQKAGLADEVRRHDWTGLARGYNGASYAKHGYHTRLAAAFRKWQRIPDTPYTAGKNPAQNTPAPTPLPKGGVIASPQPPPRKAGFFVRLVRALTRKAA